MLKSSAGKGFRVFRTNTKSQSSTTDDFFSFFGNACSSDDGSDGRGPAEGSTCLRYIRFSAAFRRWRLCALMASEPVLNIMTGLSGKLSQVGTIGVSLGQLQRCMRLRLAANLAAKMAAKWLRTWLCTWLRVAAKMAAMAAHLAVSWLRLGCDLAAKMAAHLAVSLAAHLAANLAAFVTSDQRW